MFRAIINTITQENEYQLYKPLILLFLSAALLAGKELPVTPVENLLYFAVIALVLYHLVDLVYFSTITNKVLAIGTMAGYLHWFFLLSTSIAWIAVFVIQTVSFIIDLKKKPKAVK